MLHQLNGGFIDEGDGGFHTVVSRIEYGGREGGNIGFGRCCRPPNQALYGCHCGVSEDELRPTPVGCGTSIMLAHAAAQRGQADRVTAAFIAENVTPTAHARGSSVGVTRPRARTGTGDEENTGATAERILERRFEVCCDENGNGHTLRQQAV